MRLTKRFGVWLARIGVRFIRRGLILRGATDVHAHITYTAPEQMTPFVLTNDETYVDPKPPIVQYAVTLRTFGSDYIVLVFGTEVATREWIAANPPLPTWGAGLSDLDNCANVHDDDIPNPMGYGVTELVDGKPTRYVLACEGEVDGNRFVPHAPFDKSVPLFPVHASAN